LHTMSARGPDSGRAFGERFLVAAYPTGGVVIDTETGNYYRVDGPTAEMCRVLGTSDDPDAAAQQVADRTGRPLSEVRRSMAALSDELDRPPVRGTPTGPYHFHPAPDGYALWHDGRLVLNVDGGDYQIHPPAGQGIERHPLLEMYVRAVAPKILFLRGIAAIHASACAVKQSVLAFAGPSGAGKTTTARAFVRAGAEPVCEDLLVFRLVDQRPMVVIGSEARIHEWARRTAGDIARGEKSASSVELADMATGSQRAVERIHFLDAQRRDAPEIVGRALTDAEGLIAVMANHFLGDASAGGWRRYFELATTVAAAVPLIELRVPGDLAALEAAATRYTSKVTSNGTD
jgi:hypothetical protein